MTNTRKTGRLRRFISRFTAGVALALWLGVNLLVLLMIRHGHPGYALPLGANVFAFFKTYAERGGAENSVENKNRARVAPAALSAAIVFGITLTALLVVNRLTGMDPSRVRFNVEKQPAPAAAPATPEKGVRFPLHKGRVTPP